jgi:hypothetical protein
MKIIDQINTQFSLRILVRKSDQLYFPNSDSIKYHKHSLQNIKTSLTGFK